MKYSPTLFNFLFVVVLCLAAFSMLMEMGSATKSGGDVEEMIFLVVILAICLLGIGVDYWLQKVFPYRKVMALELGMMACLFVGFWGLRFLVI